MVAAVNMWSSRALGRGSNRWCCDPSSAMIDKPSGKTFRNSVSLWINRCRAISLGNSTIKTHRRSQKQRVLKHLRSRSISISFVWLFNRFWSTPFHNFESKVSNRRNEIHQSVCCFWRRLQHFLHLENSRSASLQQATWATTTTWIFLG